MYLSVGELRAICLAFEVGTEARKACGDLPGKGGLADLPGPKKRRCRELA